MKLRELALTIIILIGLPSFAFTAEPNAKQTSGQPVTSTAETKTPVAMISEKEFTFDPVVDGSAVTHDYLVKNKGEGTLEISRVKTG